MLKKVLYTLIALLIIIQFFRPEKNLSNDNTFSIATAYPVPENINLLLDRSCKDCHSNTTRYPWYSNFQPMAWWMAGHVNDGKRHLNLSEFMKSNLARQNHKLEEIIETVKEHEMPLPSYTWLGMHPEANLTEEERLAISDWAAVQMDSLKARWPADSLVMKKR